MKIYKGSSASMIHSKSIYILQQLDKKEFTGFGKYLSSGAFTSNKSLIKLYEYLKKFYPDFSSEEITKESIYRSAYGNVKYSHDKTRKLLSDLFKETELYIAMLKLRNNKPSFQKILLSELEERRLDPLFPSLHEEMFSRFIEPPHQLTDFLNIHLLEWDNLRFNLTRGMQDKMGSHVYTRSEYLIFYTLCDTFLALQDILAHKNSFNYVKAVNLPRAFISSINHKKLFSYIQENDFPGKMVVISFYMAFIALEKFDDDSHYFKLKEFVLKNFESYHISTRRSMAAFMTNYCIRKRRLSQKRFDKELLEVYQLHIKYKLFVIGQEKYMNTDIFLNILLYFYEVGKVTELNGFIEGSIEQIQPGHRKITIALSNALLEFEKGSFETSLRQASMIKSTTFTFKHKLKVLILKNHFELGNLETGRELASSFYKSISLSKQLPELQKKRTLRFLSCYNVLIKAAESPDNKNKVKEIIESDDKNYIESVWILKKAKAALTKK